MLALAAEIADGALPAGKPPAFTAEARQTLGPDKLLVVAISTDADSAQTVAAAHAHLAAGADRVILMVPPGGEFTPGVSQLVALAPALTGAG